MMIFVLMAGVAQAAEVLDIGYGARSIGLGRTFAGQKDDAYGIFGNPASLKGLTTGEIVSMYGQMGADISYSMLGYVMPTKHGKFFAGYGNNVLSGFTSTTIDASTGRPVPVSAFDFRSDLFMTGYQNSLTNDISYGMRLKYFTKGAGTGYYGNGINADAGLLIVPNNRLSLGIEARNILLGTMGALKLSNGQTEEQPFQVDLGLGFWVQPRIGLFADYSLYKSIPNEARLGVEWRASDILSVRMGAEQKSSDLNSSYINGSAGVGLNLGLLRIDYAYHYDSLLVSNSRHFVSISINTPKITAPEAE